MEMNTDHLFQIIGVKEAELVMARLEIQRLQAELKKHQPAGEQTTPPLEVVKK